MGVSGTGKSAVARRVAALLCAAFVEGDDLHPPENVARMASGTPLTDQDRWPWLQTLAAFLEDRRASDRATVLTCSALRRQYRDVLRGAAPPERTVFLHLHGDVELLRARMSVRDHFMPASLLESQLDTLEELEPDERGTTVDVTPPVEEVVELLRDYLVREGLLAGGRASRDDR